jgi:hypothetical protein
MKVMKVEMVMTEDVFWEIDNLIENYPIVIKYELINV